MLHESLRNLSSSFESSSSPTTQSSESNEQHQSLLVMLIGIHQNLTSQRAFGKSTAKKDEEIQEQEFNRLTLRVLASLISSLDIEQDAQCAIQAFNSLPSASSASATSTEKNVSIESVQVSPSRRILDSIENKWTRIRLALEILGELVAGVDGLLDPALLGEEEYEEWNGIEKDSEMDTEEEQQKGESTSNGQIQNEQKPLLISKDIRSLLSQLPTLLLSLGKLSSISFTSPPSSSTPASKVSGKTEENLISTQIDAPASSTQAAAGTNEESQKGTYVPALSEVFSFVHVRALECLNNLLITLARSGVSDETEAAGSKEEIEDELEEEEAGDDEIPHDMEEMLSESSGTIEDVLLDHGEEDMNTEAGPEEVNGKSSSYLLDNLSFFQNVFEGLFHILVDYQERYRNVVQGSLKSKDSSFEGLQLVVEASVGCIWALSRLCGEHLVR